MARIHADYARAGARVHTANTFRTRARTAPEDWEALARRAVALCRGAVPRTHRVAGSIGPLEDCYRPDLSPTRPRAEHSALARVLADAGADLLLCETFAHPGEALVAVEEAVATGLETWLALTAGPGADLMAPGAMRACAAEAIQRGTAAVLVNCTPASRSLPYVRALAGLGAPWGCYANAGDVEEGLGWGRADARGVARYAAHAAEWVAAGAEIVGGCCGTSPEHIAALAAQRGRGTPAVGDLR